MAYSTVDVDTKEKPQKEQRNLMQSPKAQAEQIIATHGLGLSEGTKINLSAAIINAIVQAYEDAAAITRLYRRL